MPLGCSPLTTVPQRPVGTAAPACKRRRLAERHIDHKVRGNGREGCHAVGQQHQAQSVVTFEERQCLDPGTRVP